VVAEDRNELAATSGGTAITLGRRTRRPRIATLALRHERRDGGAKAWAF
jgi:hypothetical protein